MFKSHFINGNDFQKHRFKKYSNTLTKIKALSKKRYYKSEFDENFGNPRPIWNTIRSLLPSKCHKSPLENAKTDSNNKFKTIFDATEKFTIFFVQLVMNWLKTYLTTIRSSINLT